MFGTEKDTDSEIRFKIRRLRELQALRSDKHSAASDTDYQPWIDRIVSGGRQDGEFLSDPRRSYSLDALNGGSSYGDVRRSRSAVDQTHYQGYDNTNM